MMNPTILITGASGGIGGMCAYKAALKKYNVVMAYHNHAGACNELALQLEQTGARIVQVGGDLNREEDRRNIVEAALRQFGRIDVLVNNAGTSLYGAFLDMEDALIEQTVAMDLTSQMLFTKSVLHQMLRQGSGSIVNVSSMWGLAGASCEVAYSAAKAGLIGFTKALAKEMAPSGIRVNAVAPGAVETAMMAGFSSEELREIRQNIPLGRMGSALEIAESILFLAEHEYTTGQIFSPNGGTVI